MKTIPILLIAAAGLPPIMAVEPPLPAAPATLTHALAQTGKVLPVTLENSRSALRVTVEPVPEAAHGGTQARRPRYRYTIRYIDWDGGKPEQLTFCAENYFGQGYACGEVLVLTNSVSETFGMRTLAVIDCRQKRVLLNHLLFSLTDYGIKDRSYRAYWDGVDEKGNLCSGTISYSSPWHGHDWVGSPQGVGLRLGQATYDDEGSHGSEPQFPLLWYYDAETGKATVKATREGVDESRLDNYSQYVEYESAPAAP